MIATGLLTLIQSAKSGKVEKVTPASSMLVVFGVNFICECCFNALFFIVYLTCRMCARCEETEGVSSCVCLNE